MEVNEVFEKVKNLFVDELGIEAEKVTMEAKLEEDLDIDSLGIVEVVMAFEDEFEIEIDDELFCTMLWYCGTPLVDRCLVLLWFYCCGLL